MMKIINLKEHGPSSDLLDLDQEDIEWITKENKQEETHHELKKLEIIYENGKHKLRAKGHVGSILLQRSKITINIEPKFEHAWDNLFKLFEYTENVVPNFGTGDVQAETGDSLWDIFAKTFIKKTMYLIHTGLYRTYVSKTEEITAIRGRLLITQNIRSPQKFRTKHWCEFDELSYDILENQLVLYCASLLVKYVNNSKIKQELIRIKNIVLSQNVTLKLQFSLTDANLIVINRMNKKYESIFSYCKLILQKLAYKKFDNDGKITIPDFTISMWDLFEKFVNKSLIKEYGKKGFDVTFQEKTKNILVPILDYDTTDKKYGKPSRIEPDNTLSSKDKEKLILDTKWKKKVSSGDWYQMISYSLAFKCDTILLLPKFEKDYSDGFKIPEEFIRNNITIHVKTIDFEKASKASEGFIEDLNSQIHEIVRGINFKKPLPEKISAVI
jgi:5-methylcytosine-specific restriction enzyme subunit McrC